MRERDTYKRRGLRIKMEEKGEGGGERERERERVRVREKLIRGWRIMLGLPPFKQIFAFFVLHRYLD